MSRFLLSVQNAVVFVFHFLTTKCFHGDPVHDLTKQNIKHIVIVGGSFAGVSTAHRILKRAVKTMTAPFKITLVSRDTHFYWNIAAPRAIIAGQIPDEKLFKPIAAGFSHYPADQFAFVLGTATRLDSKSKQLQVSVPNDKEMTLNYDILILGTGSDTKVDTPFKSRGSTEATRDALHEYQALIETAKTIAVVGAGPTGVETAGELAFKYGSTKEIILISSGSSVLDGPRQPRSVSEAAAIALQALKVDVRLNTKVIVEKQLLDHRQELIFSNGDKIVVDMFIPTFGVKPNSSFVPAKFLDANGFVQVDEFFAVKDAEAIFAVGDVSNVEAPQFCFVEQQTKHIAKNMVLTLRGKIPNPYKASSTGIMGVQVGKKIGTGHLGSIRLPSLLVTIIRKTLFLEHLPKTVDGSML